MTNDPKPKVPKTDYDSALGPIPPDHFDNDLSFDPKPDESPGSLDEHLKQRDKPKD